MKEKFNKLLELIIKSKKNIALTITCCVIAIALVSAGIFYVVTKDEKPAAVKVVKEKESKKEEDHSEIKKYIDDIEDICIIENAKDVDLEKVAEDLINEEEKENVSALTVDDSKVDYAKAGTYPVTYTLSVKENASSEDETSTDTTTEASTNEAENEESQTADATQITDTVDVKVVDKDKGQTLANEDKVVIGDNNEVIEKDITQYVKGIKDINATVGDKVDYMNGVTFDKENIKEVTADSSKVDLSKEGNYEVIYKITSSKDAKLDTTKTIVVTVSKKEETTSNKKEETTTSDKKEETTSTSNKKNETTSSNTSTKKEESSTPAQQHTHNWVAQTTTVHHDATGHNETVQTGSTWVQDSSAWDEPIYESRTICNGCGADITGNVEHTAWCNGGCSYHVESIQTGSVHHDATGHNEPTYGTKWVQDSPAYDETVTTGYKCSTCGATK